MCSTLSERLTPSFWLCSLSSSVCSCRHRGLVDQRPSKSSFVLPSRTAFRKLVFSCDWPRLGCHRATQAHAICGVLGAELVGHWRCRQPRNKSALASKHPPLRSPCLVCMRLTATPRFLCWSPPTQELRHFLVSVQHEDGRRRRCILRQPESHSRRSAFALQMLVHLY